MIPLFGEDASLLVVFLSLVSLSSAAPRQESVVALIGAKVYPAGGGAVIPRGIILMSGGKITAVGANVTVPAGARRIPVDGKVIIPGLIDARSSLFLSPAETAAGAADRDVLDAADLFDEEAVDALRRGVTTVYITPGSRGNISGVGAVVKLGNGRTSSGVVGTPIRTQAALKLNLGVSTGSRTSSLERLSSYDAIRSAFRSAEQYARSFERYERDLKAFESQPRLAANDGPPPSTQQPNDPTTQRPTTQRPTRPRRIPAQEILLKALRREIPVRVEAHRADDILNALRLREEFKLNMILEGAEEAPLVAKEIARHRIPIVWGPTLLESGTDLDTRGQTPAGAAKLSRAGIRLALTPAGESGRASRFVLENAAAAAGHRLLREKALLAITTDAAQILGVGDMLGSIAVGKDADLVILSAPPFDPAAKVEQVYVNGERVYAR